MNQLTSLQQQFWDSLRNRKTSSVCALLSSTNKKLTPEERLDIYRNTARTAHIDALAQSYPCCKKILGKRYFKQIANEYFYKYPATSQNLNLYGESFPLFLQDWIENHAELIDYQYLPDMAKLEWAYEQAYYAKDDPLFDFNSLPTLHHDHYQYICFRPSASLSVLRSSYPIHEIWRANREQDKSQEIDAISGPQYLCIARDNFKPVVHKIDHACWWVIDKIQNGLSLGECESLATRENIDAQLQKILPELVRRKWICGYYFKRDR